MDKRYSIIHLRRVTLAANYCFAIRGKQVFTNCYNSSYLVRNIAHLASSEFNYISYPVT